MSGLAALVGPGASAPAVEAMLAAAPHRGSRRVVRAAGGAVLGVQRRPGGHPHGGSGVHLDGRVAVASAGALYRGEAVVSGDEAARRIARSFAAGGMAAVGALRGSFAAVVVDLDGPRWFAVRSPVGEVPLFTRSRGGLAAFGSEVKQVLAAPLPAPAPDLEALLAAVAMSPGSPERTPYRGVRRVRAGQWVEAAGDEVRRSVFWDPRARLPGPRVPFAEAVEEFTRLLRVALARRLAPGTAVLLSGGLDSSAVAAEAAPLHAERFGSPLPVVSAAYPDHPEVDESRYVRSTVQALGTRATWVRPCPRPFAGVDAEAGLHDGPCPAPLASNARDLLRAAREAGYTRFLDGHDGDAVLGGQRGLVPALLKRLAVRQVGRYLGFVRRRHGLGWGRSVRRYLLPAMAGAHLRSAYARRRGRGAPVLPPWVVDPLAPLLAARHPEGDWYEAEARVLDGPMEVALETVERVALSEGVDLLHPLADPDVVEFLLSLPPEVKFALGATKSLVRAGYPQLPEAVTRRTDKTAFDPLMVAGAARDEVVSAIRGGPRSLPGVDWDRLADRAERGGLPFSELALVLRVVQADRLLARS